MPTNGKPIGIINTRPSDGLQAATFGRLAIADFEPGYYSSGSLLIGLLAKSIFVNLTRSNGRERSIALR